MSVSDRDGVGMVAMIRKAQSDANGAQGLAQEALNLAEDVKGLAESAADDCATLFDAMDRHGRDIAAIRDDMAGLRRLVAETVIKVSSVGKHVEAAK